jgi:hypothetical protein
MLHKYEKEIQQFSYMEMRQMKIFLTQKGVAHLFLI